jgi:signal transduction histidine kinase
MVIAQLNRAVVSNLNISSMLFSASEIVGQNIKAEFCYFILQDDSTQTTRLFGKTKKPMSSRELSTISQDLARTTSKIVITDFILGENNKIKKVLRSNDVSVIGRLESNVYDNGSVRSFIVLGPKKGGNLYNTKDIRLLETVIDGLIVAIQNALRFEEIQSFNVTLQQRIEEATGQLRRTNAKLKALDETKDDFISMASHQLRTPLTSIKGYLSMVLEGDAGKLTPMQRKMLDQAFISSQRMVFLIADLLNVSRLKTGKFLIEPAPVNLAKIVDDEVNQLQATAKDRSLVLEYTKPENFPMLMLDETKIRQVVMNFIDNAIYYTPSGGKIRVSLETRPDSIDFKVIDTGIGVPKSEQPHLFTKFYRAGNARQTRPDGTGLGLFMAKKVIIAQHGSVIFESKESTGSTFGFTFSREKLGVPSTELSKV